MRTTALLSLVLCTVMSACATPAETPMLDSDPSFEIVDRELQRLRDLYAANDKVAPVVHPVMELSAPYARDLLPGFSFFVISHDQRRRRGVPKEEPLSLGIGLYWVLAIAPNRQLWRLAGSGSYSDFGNLLAARRIPLHSADDAEIIWLAFCELHRKSWQEYPFEQVSRDVWHLGKYADDDTEYYYDISLDGHGIVATAQLRAVAKD